MKQYEFKVDLTDTPIITYRPDNVLQVAFIKEEIGTKKYIVSIIVGEEQ